jgi:hypothetical protein
MASLAVHPQQAPPTLSPRNDTAGVGTATVDEQLKMFTEALDLAAPQRVEMRLILQRLQDVTENVAHRAVAVMEPVNNRPL